MRPVIPVVDLFAGPGGLAEGFSSYHLEGRKQSPFKILVSVEKDYHAHQTLELRSFFRQFINRPVPDDYYRYLRREITRDDLFAAWPREARAAGKESLHRELGTRDNTEIYGHIDRRLEKYHTTDWVLIGGPPCQAYSTIGRARMRSQNPDEFEKDHRHFLYQEYLRIIARFRPAAFVMENVKGLLSSRMGDSLIFDRILSDLKSPIAALEQEEAGIPLFYKIYSLVVQKDKPEDLEPKDFIIEAEKYGIPQTRHRVILLGVRGDIPITPDAISQFGGQVPVCQALSDLPEIRSYLSKEVDQEQNWLATIRTIETRDWFQNIGADHLFGSDFQQTLRAAMAAIPVGLSIGGEFLQGPAAPVYRPDWYHDSRLQGTCNHTSRSHMGDDLHRYLFAACYAQAYGVSPLLRHFPPALRPNHQNAQGDSDLETFDDRFRVQVSNRPATTITSHISKDGHYNIHYDPLQCRSLTVREAARIQTFPDNYFFEGTRTQQYRQVGNAVPPLLARQIADVVNTLFEKIHAIKRSSRR